MRPDRVILRLARELATISDPALVARIGELMVEPKGVELDWDYGTPGQTFACWVVMEDPESGVRVVYCEDGFGPARPWGLVGLNRPGMGMDSGWFDSLENAVRESWIWDGN